MKKYNKPEISVCEIEQNDVIATSTEPVFARGLYEAFQVNIAEIEL